MFESSIPEKPRGEENENSGQRAETRWRVIHFDVEEIFLDLSHLHRARFNADKKV